jgi:anti-anti-sigma factor
MGMSISSRSDGGIAILEIHGNIRLGPSLHAFQSKARRVLNEPGCAGLVLNLAQVSGMDSAGIGGLVAIHSSAARRGLRVVVVRPSAGVKEILAITRVDELFNFVGDEHSAIRSLRLEHIPHAQGPDQPQ